MVRPSVNVIMILIDILSTYQTIIISFASDPFMDSTQVFAVLAGISVAMRIIKKISSGF